MIPYRAIPEAIVARLRAGLVPTEGAFVVDGFWKEYFAGEYSRLYFVRPGIEHCLEETNQGQQEQSEFFIMGAKRVDSGATLPWTQVDDTAPYALQAEMIEYVEKAMRLPNVNLDFKSDQVLNTEVTDKNKDTHVGPSWVGIEIRVLVTWFHLADFSDWP